MSFKPLGWTIPNYFLDFNGLLFFFAPVFEIDSPFWYKFQMSFARRFHHGI